VNTRKQGMLWCLAFAIFASLSLALVIVVGPILGKLGGRTLAIFMAKRDVSWDNVPRRVLAFYYPWYGNPRVSGEWFHWSDVDENNKRIGSSAHYPILGPYDSHDSQVIEQHLLWAREAGIDGFIVSWWRPRDFHDQAMPLLLSAAQRFGLEISAYIETVGTKERALEYVLYLLRSYGGHPAWLRLERKPVIFIYKRAIDEIGLDGWFWVIEKTNRLYEGGAVFIGDVLGYRLPQVEWLFRTDFWKIAEFIDNVAFKGAVSVFDGVHTYNVTELTAGKSANQIWNEMKETFSEWVRPVGKYRISCLTVIPGYDDSKLSDRKPPRPITERHEGQTYRVLWEAAIVANPDWVLITSWNEWHEGTEIEPSVEFSDRELKTTAVYSRKFKLLENKN